MYQYSYCVVSLEVFTVRRVTTKRAGNYHKQNVYIYHFCVCAHSNYNYIVSCVVFMFSDVANNVSIQEVQDTQQNKIFLILHTSCTCTFVENVVFGIH